MLPKQRPLISPYHSFKLTSMIRIARVALCFCLLNVSLSVAFSQAATVRLRDAKGPLSIVAKADASNAGLLQRLRARPRKKFSQHHLPSNVLLTAVPELVVCLASIRVTGDKFRFASVAVASPDPPPA